MHVCLKRYVTKRDILEYTIDEGVANSIFDATGCNFQWSEFGKLTFLLSSGSVRSEEETMLILPLSKMEERYRKYGPTLNEGCLEVFVLKIPFDDAMHIRQVLVETPDCRDISFYYVDDRVLESSITIGFTPPSDDSLIDFSNPPCDLRGDSPSSVSYTSDEVKFILDLLQLMNSLTGVDLGNTEVTEK